MKSLFTYLFSLVFPDLNEYFNDFRSLSDSKSDYDSESDLLYEFDIDTTDPQHFLTYG